MMTVSLLIPLALAAAGQAAGAPEPNVAVTLIVGRIGGAAEAAPKTYKMLGQLDKTTQILMGWKMPIPTRSSGDAGETTSYVYQNIGVSAELLPRLLADGRFLLEGQIEISGTREAKGDEATRALKAPLIGTFQQVLHVVLPRGKKVRIAEAPDPEAGTLYLDVEVNLAE